MKDYEEYLSQFDTKDKVKTELAHIQKNMENLRFGRFDLHQLLWERKRRLLQIYQQKYCRPAHYMDDLGRTHWYFEEIEGEDNGQAR